MKHCTLAHIYFFYFPIFIFKANHVFMEKKDSPVKKAVIVEEELDGI